MLRNSRLFFIYAKFYLFPVIHVYEFVFCLHLFAIWLEKSLVFTLIQCTCTFTDDTVFFCPFATFKNSTVDLLFLMTINFIFIAKHQCQFQIYFILQQQSFTTVKQNIFHQNIMNRSTCICSGSIQYRDKSHNHFYKLSKVDVHYTVFIKCIIQGLWD